MPHIHEKIDFTVEVFVVYKDRVLLRKHDKYKKWLSVGGHIELDEDPNEAAIREVREEVGLDVVLAQPQLPATGAGQADDYRELIPPKFLNRHRISDTHEHVTLVYFAQAATDHFVIPNNHEKSEDVKWFTKSELEKNDYGISDTIRFYALRALAELGVGY